MNRTPWTVDDDLSRLQAEIRESQREHPSTAPSGPKDDCPLQQIEGHHNIQVAGDLPLQALGRVDPNHPQAVRRPQYRHGTYGCSDWCTECNFNLSGYRIARAKQERRRRQINIILCSWIPVVLIVFVATKFLTGTADLYFLWVGAGLLAAARLAAPRRQRI